MGFYETQEANYEYRKSMRESYNEGYEAGYEQGKRDISSKWIPVNEKLPKEKDAGILKKLGINKKSDYVIATVEVKGERMTVIACTHDGAWDWNMKYAFPNYKIIAWMEKPKPWEGEENG